MGYIGGLNTPLYPPFLAISGAKMAPCEAKIGVVNMGYSPPIYTPIYPLYTPRYAGDTIGIS